ncbi:MAG TPA: AI-2E family transporter [Actinomycetota bacterium]|nr:AI-2E family transporter [Actinomycetota bacterium]
MAEQHEEWRRRWPPMSYWARVTVVVSVTLFVLGQAMIVRDVLMLLLIAAVLAVGLDRAVGRLERFRITRGWAVAVIFLAAVAFVGLFVSLVVPPLVAEVRDLAANIPDYVDRLSQQQGWLGDFVREHDLADELQNLTERLPSLASASFGTILGFTRGVASVIFNTLTIAILTVYFLLSMPKMRTTSVALFRPELRERGGRVLGEALGRIGGYVSGNLLTSAIAGIAALVFLTVFGIPFAVALAMWVAITDLIPAIGATLGAIVAVTVAFFSSTGDGVAALVYFIVYQQLENYLIVPRVMKGAVDLSPAAVIVSTLIGGSLAGFAGVLLALPLAAAIKVVVNDVWLGERLAAGAEEA